MAEDIALQQLVTELVREEVSSHPLAQRMSMIPLRSLKDKKYICSIAAIHY